MPNCHWRKDFFFFPKEASHHFFSSFYEERKRSSSSGNLLCSQTHLSLSFVLLQQHIFHKVCTTDLWTFPQIYFRCEAIRFLSLSLSLSHDNLSRVKTAADPTFCDREMALMSRNIISFIAALSRYIRTGKRVSPISCNQKEEKAFSILFEKCWGQKML